MFTCCTFIRKAIITITFFSWNISFAIMRVYIAWPTISCSPKYNLTRASF